MKRRLARLSAAFAALVLIASISVTSIYADTFWVLDDFEFVKNNDGSITITDYLKETSELKFPEQLIDMPVTAVDSSAFSKREDIQKVIFPSSLQTINYFSFSECSTLNNIVFSDNISVIAVGAFQDCDSLVNVNMKKTKIKRVNEQMFYKCNMLESVFLPETCERIDKFSFAECPRLDYLYIPASVTYIDTQAFDNSPNLAIYGKFNSYAQKFAKENGIPFFMVSDYRMGDINLDGTLDISDVTYYQRFVVDVESFSPMQYSLADINNDGDFNIVDATEIQRIIVNE